MNLTKKREKMLILTAVSLAGVATALTIVQVSEFTIIKPAARWQTTSKRIAPCGQVNKVYIDSPEYVGDGFKANPRVKLSDFGMYLFLVYFIIIFFANHHLI